jgi:1-acyl-sn-glycerol-3-phosphate acyltransferase
MERSGRGDLGSLVAEVLGSDRPPADDDRLADIGFDSLAYAELATVLQQDAGVDMLDAGMAEIGTVGELRAMVDAAAANPGGAGERFPEGLGRAQRRVKRALAGLFRSWFDLTVVGAEHVPVTGPAVLCMNHESGLDIPAGVVSCPRPITFMAKRELFRRPAQARVFRRWGAFPVDRDLFDLRAVEVGLEVVRRGEVLGMYPEGTRTPGTLLPFLPGAPWIALKTGAPLVPCAIAGTERALPRGRRIPKRAPIRVTFVEPVVVEAIDDPVKRRAESERLAGELREAIRPLLSY